MLLRAGVLLSMGARITLDVLYFTGRCMSRNVIALGTSWEENKQNLLHNPSKSEHLANQNHHHEQ